MLARSVLTKSICSAPGASLIDDGGSIIQRERLSGVELPLLYVLNANGSILSDVEEIAARSPTRGQLLRIL